MSTALRRVLATVRPPRVSLVVVVQGGSELRCLETLPAAGARLEILLACHPQDVDARRVVEDAAHRHPRVVVCRTADPSWLDAAIQLARGDHLAFVPADDVVPASAYDALLAALDSSGSDLALGVHVDVRGDRRRRVPWAGDVLQEARGVVLADRPGLVVDVAATGKLFRLSRWRSAGVSLPSWGEAPAAVARMMAGARGMDVLARVVHERHDRQTSLPVHEQDRFRADVLADRWAAWSDVEAVLTDQPAPVREAWLLGLVEHRLPPLYVDAVGGGPSYAAVLTPRTAALLVRMTPDVLRRVSLPARLGAWAATHGTLEDIALVQDHLADHPHGLPTERGSTGTLAALPDGLSSTPSPRWRHVTDVDRRLRSRAWLVPAGPGLVELRGAAFLDYVPDDELPVVRIGDRPVQLRRHTSPDLQLWAARAHEDRSGCGFSATLTLAELGGTDPWTVTVELAGRAHRHRVHPPSDHTAAADVVLSALRLVGDELHAEVRAAGPCRVRLAGPKGQVEAMADGSGLRVPLTVDRFGERGLLPAGGYALEVRREDGRRSTVEVAELRDGPVEVTGERVRLELRQADTGPRVTVASPPALPDRSARGQQQLLDEVYRAGARTRGSATVLLETFRGRSAGDNPGAVGRALLASDRARGLDLAVVVDDPAVVVPPGTRAVPRRTRAWYDALARAEVYVANAGAPYWFRKSPGQLHVQTWHGTPLKRIGEDRGPGDFATWRHRRRIADQARGWDAMVSPSPYCSEIYRSAFGYDGTILEVGYPRNDVLLAPDADVLRERVRHRLGIGADDRVVLYAPTWRQYVGVRDAKPLYLDAEAVVRAMPDVVVLVRGHYNSTTEDDVFVDHPRIHDVTRYPDIAELFLAADALVTDYSSVMFDFVLTDRPVVLLVPDLDQYRDVERGFYFDIEARSPGRLVTTTADVVDVLTGPDTDAGRRADFRSVFCPFEDGAASTRVVEYCLDRLSGTSTSASPTERSP